MKKTIKLFLSFVVVVMTAISYTSCMSGDSLAEKYVDEMNKTGAAMNVSGVMSFDGAKIEGKDIVIAAKMEIEFGPMCPKDDFLAGVKSATSAETLVAQGGSLGDKTFKKLAESGYSFVFRYIDQKGDTAEVRITSSEILEAIR